MIIPGSCFIPYWTAITPTPSPYPCGSPIILTASASSNQTTILPALEDAFTFSFYLTMNNLAGGGDRILLASNGWNDAGTWAFNFYGGELTFFGEYMTQKCYIPIGWLSDGVRAKITLARDVGGDPHFFVDSSYASINGSTGSNNLTASGAATIGSRPGNVQPLWTPGGALIEDFYLCNGGYFPPDSSPPPPSTCNPLSEPLLGLSEFWPLPVLTQYTSTYARSARSETLGLFIQVRPGKAFTSPDGQTWTETTDRPDANPGPNTVEIYDAIWVDSLDKFLVPLRIGNTSPYFIASSADGVNWTRTSVSNIITKIFQGGPAGILYGVANSTGLLTSVDGITWTQHPVPSELDGIRSVVWSEQHGKYVGFGSKWISGIGTNYYTASSVDGITWTDRSAAITSDGQWGQIGWSPTLERYVVAGVGNSSFMTFYSPDGVTWTRGGNLEVGGTNYPVEIFWVEEIHAFILISNGSSVGVSSSYFSRDGITWTAIFYGQYMNFNGCAAFLSFNDAVWSKSLGRFVFTLRQGCFAHTWTITSGYCEPPLSG